MMQSNLKVAITGGIGSGKSAASSIIKEQGYTVFSCDDIYRELLNDKTFLNQLSNEFGEILTADGNLDRKQLSAIVFKDKNKLKRLNEITHPVIINEALRRMSGEGIYFCEVPLLFEGEFESLFDAVIVILRDKELRIASVSKRDKISKKDVERRINSQFDYENKQFEKYYVIHNNSDLEYLRTETLNILEKIIL